MSERGVFAVDRGIFDHPAFQREPFTQREAWLWLVAEAAFKERTKRADGKIITLKRGQLCHSIRFMAEAWQWSKSRADRFLTMLENRDMLRSETGTRTPVITICNYSDYQRVSLPERDKSGTTSGTRAGQERDKLEGTENTEIPSETSSLRGAGEPARAAAKPVSERDHFAQILSAGISPDRAAAIADHRKRQKWPLSEQSARLMVKNLIASGDPNAGADLVIERGWRGFEPSWLGRNQDPRAGPTGARDAPRRPSGSDRLLNAMNGMFDDDQPTTSAQQPLRIAAHPSAGKA